MQRTELERLEGNRGGIIQVWSGLRRLTHAICRDLLSSAGQPLRLLAAELRKFG